MKITKRQLRRIIKEEKANILAEQKVRSVVRRKLLEQAGREVAGSLGPLSGGLKPIDYADVPITDEPHHISLYHIKRGERGEDCQIAYLADPADAEELGMTPKEYSKAVFYKLKEHASQYGCRIRGGSYLSGPAGFGPAIVAEGTLENLRKLAQKVDQAFGGNGISDAEFQYMVHCFDDGRDGPRGL